MPSTQQYNTVSHFMVLLNISIDSKLNFQKKLIEIERKISRAVGIMFKLKSLLPQEALLKLYYALIHPHLIYGIIVWGSTFSTYLNGLTKLQNKPMKIVGGGKFRDSATPYYIKFKVLKVPELYRYETANLSTASFITIFVIPLLTTL